MAHFALLWKTRAVEKLKLNYEKEKTKSIVLANVELPRQRISEKWRSYRSSVSTKVSRTFSRWFPKGSAIYSCILYLKTDQTFLTILFKSILGFIGGIILTYLCFMFFVFQLSISLEIAMVLSSVIGVLLTLGLTFSYRIRCLVFLLIPQLFSRVGRYTLTCYALVLILTGPATNTLKNSEILSESMACSQEHIKARVHEINDAYKNPYNFVKDDIELMINSFKKISDQLTTIVVKINRLVLSIVSYVQLSFNWLKTIAADSNKRFGKPYDYCKHLLNEGLKNCKETLGHNYLGLYQVNIVTEAACENMKRHESFCEISELFDDSILDTVKKKLKTFSGRIAAMLYIKVHIHHSYSFSSNVSGSASQVAAGIVTEIRNRADPLLTWLSWSSCVTSLFLLLIIFRAKYYQQMYDTRSRFDNRYITQELRDLDLDRLREGRKTILPLNRRERVKYVTTTSFRLVPSEKIHLNRSAVFMIITTFKLLIHIVADYSLYWVLITIRHYGKLQSAVEEEFSDIGMNMSGSPIAARFLQSLINTLKIPLSSPISCLPEPHPPDLGRYMQIGVLIFLLWFFAMFEPYGLRLRHVIMGRYLPERAKARATWLYNHILRTRGVFMKFARKKLHREFKYNTEAHLTFKKWISALIPCKCLHYLFGLCVEERHCLLCGAKEYSNNFDDELIRCKSKNCQGTYCNRCFSDIGELCTICLSPKDYGDLSDVSLEKGSSEESSDSDSDESTEHQLKNSKTNFCNNTKNYQERHKIYFRKEHNDKNNLYLFPKSNPQEDKTPLPPYKNHQIVMLKNSRLHYNLILLYLNAANVNNKIDQIDIISKETYDKEKKQFKAIYGDICTLKLELIWYADTLYKFHELPLYDRLNVLLSMKVIAYHLKIFGKQLTFYKIHKVNNFLSVIRVKRTIEWRRHSKGFIRNKKKRVKKKRKDSQHSQNPKVSSIALNDSNYIADRYFIKQDGNNIEQSINSLCNLNNNNTSGSSKNNINQNVIQKGIRRHKEKQNKISCFGKFNTVCFKCWNDFKVNLLPCTDPMDGSRKLLYSNEEIKNYKRRKKHKNVLGLKKSNSLTRAKKEIDETRKFRIFRYFSDQEWKKTKSETKFYKIKIDSNKELGKALEGVKIESAAHKIKKNEPEFTVKSNNGSLGFIGSKYEAYVQSRNSIRPSNYPPSEYQKYIDRINILGKEYTKKAILRFRETLGLKLLTTSSSTDIVNNLTTGDQKEQMEKDIIPTCPQSSTSFSRRFNFYRSLGINEFDDMYDNVKENKVNPFKGLESSSKLRNERAQIISVKKSTNKIIRNMACGTSVGPSIPKKCRVCTKGDVVNKKWMHITLKNPLYVLKEFYSSITGHFSNDNEYHEKHTPVSTASKGVAVMPMTKSFSCQCIIKEAPKDVTTQIHSEHKMKYSEPLCKPSPLGFTAPVDTVPKPTHGDCTCVTQRTIIHRDMGTWVNHREQEQHINDSCYSTSSSNDSLVFSNLPSVIYENSDETNKTDTTVLSLPTIDYTEGRRGRERKGRVKIVTKANQSTATDKVNLCDVSTVTDDWWSPILEKKKIRNSPVLQRKEREINISLEKTGEGLMVQKVRTRKRMRNRGMTTDAKIVTFKSRAQIIPGDIVDTLTPSRYLLESQKYYNELFSSRFHGDRVIPVLQLQKQCSDSKEKSPTSSQRHAGRGIKTKRLEENYSPTKQFSSRKRYSDSAITSENPSRLQAFKQDKLHRMNIKSSSKKETREYRTKESMK